MNLVRWPAVQEWLRRWVQRRDTPRTEAAAPRFFERDVMLIIRLVVLGLLAYYLFGSGLANTGRVPGWEERGAGMHEAWQIALRTVQALFFLYLALSVGTGFLLLGARHLRPPGRQALVFGVALLDAWFLAAVVALTGGVESQLYWLYVLLLLRNCRTMPSVALQVTLNLLTILSFSVGAVTDGMISRLDDELARPAQPDLAGSAGTPLSLPDPFTVAEGLGRPFVLRLVLLAVVAVWFQGLNYLIERERRTREEERELALRREQLAASGRLAAEIAHQLKNPLSIISTASYTLQKTVREGKTITQQIQIIREEVAKSDRLITELMGYAQLVEGRVEKLDLKEEIEAAVARVFPPAVRYEMRIHRDYAAGLPRLLAHRNHLQDAFVNVLQNARDVMGGRGNIWIRTRQGEDFSVRVEFEDDGPGVPPELRGRIFEPYFSTREKGTGLGLAIVKHNVELYGGSVWVEECALGRGARFVLKFPARTLLRLRT
jgi:signal transduction histidine kinase